VGRGADQSYCILLTGSKLGKDARERIRMMCDTNDGFKIAEKDMELRGPGDNEGTRQSGVLNFKLASIVADADLMILAAREAENLLENDVELNKEEHKALKQRLLRKQDKTIWGKIS